MSDELSLARKHQREIGDRIGWHNVRFYKGKIQDQALDLDKLQIHLLERISKLASRRRQPPDVQ